MKASIKFREDQKPMFRAKVPLSILGSPFQSGISAGDTKELCLSFSTLFESGPSIKLSYRPNDSWNPFSLAVKTGIGHFGSPIAAPMTMSAEFNLLGNGNPSFFLHFRPRIGDFSIRKSVGSQIALRSQSPVFVPKNKAPANDVDSENDVSVDGDRKPTVNGVFSGTAVNGFLASKTICGLFSGLELSARTALPLRDRTAMKLRWGVRFPGDEIANRTADIPFRKIPFLVLSKIAIEHVPVNQGPARHADVVATCFAVKREVEALQTESGSLRKGIEELGAQIGAGKSSPVAEARDSGTDGQAERNIGLQTAAGKKRNKERKSSDESYDNVLSEA